MVECELQPKFILFDLLSGQKPGHYGDGMDRVLRHMRHQTALDWLKLCPAGLLEDIAFTGEVPEWEINLFVNSCSLQPSIIP